MPSLSSVKSLRVLVSKFTYKIQIDAIFAITTKKFELAYKSMLLTEINVY
jgi:hypothetical protein